MILGKWIKGHKIEISVIILAIGIVIYMHRMHAFASKDQEMLNPDLKRIQECLKNNSCPSIGGSPDSQVGPANPIPGAQDFTPAIAGRLFK